MENKKGKTLKLISYISLCAFSLVSLFSGVLAWFTARRVQDPDSDSMRVVNPAGLISEVKIYEQETDQKGKTIPFSYNNQAVVTYDLTNGVTKTGSTELGTYDQLEPPYSLLYLFKINPSYASNTELSLNIKAKTESDEGDCFLNTVDPNTQETRRKDLHPMSPEDKITENDGQTSIIKYYCFTLDEEPATFDYSVKENDDPNSEYNYKTFTESSFVTLNNEELYSSFSQEVSIYSRTSNGEGGYTTLPKYIGMICGYYEQAIQTLYGIYLNYYALERMGEDSNPIPVVFNCDWYLEIA